MISCSDVIQQLRPHLSDGAIYPSKNEAIRLEPLPMVGEHAYQHVLFPGLSLDEIDNALFAAGLTVPQSFRRFLSEINGMILFQGGLAIYGVRGEISRDPDVRKPFDVIEANTLGRPLQSAEDDFFIGSFDQDGSRLFLRGQESQVFRRPRKSAEVMARWPDIESMLSSEIERLATGLKGQSKGTS